MWERLQAKKMKLEGEKKMVEHSLVSLLSCDLIPLVLKDEPRRGRHHTEWVKEEYLQRAEAGLPGEEADCLPPTCLALGAGTKVQKATCDLSSSLTYQRFPPTQLLHISRDVHFQRRAGGVGERGDEYRGERKYMHMLGADLVPPPPKKNYTILHPLGLFVCLYLFAWLVQKQRNCPLCCSSSGGSWTGTGTPGCPSWRLRRCNGCGPGRADTASSGPATGPPAGCTAAARRWCKPPGSAEGSWPETWSHGRDTNEEKPEWTINNTD